MPKRTSLQSTNAKRLALLLVLCVASHAVATTVSDGAIHDAVRRSVATTGDVADAFGGVVEDSVSAVQANLHRVRAELEELALRYTTSVPSWEMRAAEVRRGILQGAAEAVRGSGSSSSRRRRFRAGCTSRSCRPWTSAPDVLRL
jgi:hypothetical protein